MSEVSTTRGTLPAAAPFDFGKSISFLNGFGPYRSEFRIEDNQLTRAVMIDGETIVFRVTSAGTVDQPALDYTLYSAAPLTDALHEAAVDRIRFFLSLDDDLTPFYALAHDDPAFEPVLTYLYGYHQVKFLTAFENACWAILSQRNLMTLSTRMKQAITERYGGALTVDGVLYTAFPEPAQLALASGGELSALIGHKPKGALLEGVARAFDQMDEQWLRDAPYAEVERWLKAIKGIGDWSASFVLLRGLGRMECVPRGDKWLLQAASRTYGLGAGADDAMIQRLAAPYGEWAGYWAHYLRAST